MALYSVDDRRLKHSLNLVIFSVCFGMVFFTVFGTPVGSAVFTGFMRKLGAGDLVYSVVMALPVLGAVSQIFGSYYLERTGKRRFLFLASGLVHRLLWIPVALLPLLLGVQQRTACIWLATVLITVSSVASSINSIAFSSWMGVMVPSDIAGRFFGVRTLLSTITGAVAALIVGVVIDQLDSLVGFAIVFVIGALFGTVDIATFFFVDHPPLIPPERKPSLRSIIVEPFHDKNYLRLALFATAFGFAVNFSGPFVNIYLIEQLKMNYLVIALSGQVISSVTTVLCVRRWGVLADRYGNRPVVLVSSVGIVFLMALYIFTTPTNYTLVFVSSFFTGIFWAGYNLALYNQSVWLAPEQNRSAYLACFALLTSVPGAAFAYVCGGFFMQFAGPLIDAAQLPFVMGRPLSRYQALFLLTSVMRLLAVIFFLPAVREKNARPARVMLREEMRLLRERLVRR